jgi:4-alpha-glucanotransferase
MRKRSALEYQVIDKRAAGILLHITSLPSRYGIGDLGPEAYAFADFLQRSKQSYWQLLPLNPVEKAQGYSPYSSTSSMAGNTLLISPELLVKMKLLSPKVLEGREIRNQGKVDFEKSETLREELFETAFAQFQKSSDEVHRQYELYKRKEKKWLDEFAVYAVLKRLHNNRPWYEWPADYKMRHPEILSKVRKQHKLAINREMWMQFIFNQQWLNLKAYCNKKGIKLFGDLPFYVSYDSADVWANPELFALDKNRNAAAVAGVPPDYFNENGQLWGMPVFRWDVLKQTKYDWWIKRLKKNTEQFDVVRLDHFRAFADYWEVKSSERTAKRGKWKPGPGVDFFHQIKRTIGELPFIAEDLGDINQPVYDLRDEFQFPGMKVLQFAFGDNVGMSDYIPHNYTPNFIVYTGTHDNNTTRGWFSRDIDRKTRKNISTYFGHAVTEDSINHECMRAAYGSVARLAIVPMQDVLGLDETARINTPASVKDNWLWRLKENQLKEKTEKSLSMLMEIYNRA